MAQRRIKRAHPTYLGVYQRCVDQCPEPCDAHTWTWHAQAPSDERRGAFVSSGPYRIDMVHPHVRADTGAAIVPLARQEWTG